MAVPSGDKNSTSFRSSQALTGYRWRTTYAVQDKTPIKRIMALLPIITAPDPRLKVTSSSIEQVDDDVRRLLDDMLETMYQAPGIGLSAVQVGIPKRVITVDIAEEDDDGEQVRTPIFLVNPKILHYSEQVSIYDEGCLSLPEHFAEIERPEAIKVGFLDYDGKPAELDADGLLARCIQHEIDHLEGILFVDHLSAVKRNMILRKLIKARRQKAAV
jgi:peptide deformylase